MEKKNLDSGWMEQALAAARAVKGSTYPNPAVGALVVRGDTRLAFGATLPAGDDHAEVVALKQAGHEAAGATLYVSLEPCSHQGRTPPCTDAIIAAGIRRVVVACRDPDPRVDGRGIARLRAAGIMVEEGILEREACAVNREFFHHRTTGLPFVTLKYAMTLDGKLACDSGDSRWISSAEARVHAHQLRKQCQAVLVGRGTVIRDDPSLDCRLPDVAEIFQPFPLVLSLSGRLPREARVWKNPRSLLVTSRAGAKTADFLEDTRKLVLADQAPLADILRELGKREIVSLLVEGGAAIHTAFLRERLFGRLVVYIAPKICGGHLVPAADLGIERMADAFGFQGAWSVLGADACFEAEVFHDA